jgi:hypothetical protein
VTPPSAVAAKFSKLSGLKRDAVNIRMPGTQYCRRPPHEKPTFVGAQYQWTNQPTARNP